VLSSTSDTLLTVLDVLWKPTLAFLRADSNNGNSTSYGNSTNLK